MNGRVALAVRVKALKRLLGAVRPETQTYDSESRSLEHAGLSIVPDCHYSSTRLHEGYTTFFNQLITYVIYK
jgi:hypothetical protein